MKELSIEEKAQRYDEALEKAKKNYITAQDLCEGAKIDVECFKNTLESIFPELAESKDEKIREKLIENFKWFCGDYPNTTKWGKDDDMLVKDILAWLEKQGGKKSDWSEEDERIIKRIDLLLYAIHESEFEDIHAWLKSLKQRMI